MDMLAVYVGLDYHRETVRVCVLSEAGDELCNRSVSSEVELVTEAVRNCGGQRQRSGSSKPVSVSVRGVAIAAGAGSIGFATRLTQATDWPVKLAHAGAVQRLTQGLDQTGHGDAWHLAHLIRGNDLPEVWLTDEFTRQLRLLVRHRQDLEADVKNVKQEVRLLLQEEGVAESYRADAWTKAWLQEVALPEHARWILEMQLALLEQFQQQIAEVDARLQEAIG